MKPRKIKLTEKDKQNGIAEKYAYRGYEIHIIDDGTSEEETEKWYYAKIVCLDGTPITGYSDDSSEPDVVLEAACDWLDHKLDDPKKARKRLKECDTQTLLNIFYCYATFAPAWANEVMEMVAEKKKRAWLISQIADELLTDDELIEEMGV